MTPRRRSSRRSTPIEPVEIQEEMERSFLDYAMSVITARGAPRRARRSQAGAPPDPLRDVRRRAASRPQAQEVRPARSARSWASTTRTATARSTTRWPAWPRTSSCATPWSTGTATSAHPTRTTVRPPSATPKRGSAPLAMQLLADIDEDTVDFVGDLRRPAPASRRCCRPGSRTCWSTARRHRGRHGHEHPSAQPGRGHRRGGAPARPPGRDGRPT